MREPRYGKVGLEGLTLIGFVGRGAADEVLGRALRRVRGREPATEGFLAASGAPERVAVSPAARLESVAGARSPGRPVLGRVDCRENAGVGLGGGVAGLGHLVLATAGPRGLSAAELARRLRDRWIPPLQLVVARTLAALRSPVALLVSTACEPGRLVAASSGPPLWLAVSEKGVLLSSDAGLARVFSRRIVLARPGELAVADAEGFDLLCARTLARLPRSPAGTRVPVDDSLRAHAGSRPDPARGAPAGEAA